MCKAHLTAFGKALIETRPVKANSRSNDFLTFLTGCVFCLRFLVNSATARTKSRLTWRRWWRACRTLLCSGWIDCESHACASLSFIRVRYKLAETQFCGSESSSLFRVLSLCFLELQCKQVRTRQILLLNGFTFYNIHSRRVSVKCQITNELTR